MDEELVEFKCVIFDIRKDSNKDDFNASRSPNETVQGFTTWVTNNYDLPGEVKLFKGKRELQQPGLSLSDLYIEKKDTLTVKFDSKVLAGGGGLGQGGLGSKEHKSLAKGGIGGGGEATFEFVRGGDGLGGGVEGFGRGGAGKGGPANNPHKGMWAKGGDGIGGPVTVHNTKQGRHTENA